MKIIVIIQARMRSSRLPGKSMIEIDGRPILQYVLERVKKSKFIQQIYLATTKNAADDVLEQWANKNGITCFRGSETDVLDSFYQVASKVKPDSIVRITGDCPLADYNIIDKVIEGYLRQNCDYASNVHPPTYPDGLDVEIFSCDAIIKAWQNAKLNSERQHVTPYIWKNPQIFKTCNIACQEDFSNLRLTLDTAEDLKLLSLVIGACNQRKKYCDLEAILEIIKEHPEWAEINRRHLRNEGYLKSVGEDKK
jgi:spore coat polysaccharide biosynthesis protein SpsF